MKVAKLTVSQKNLLLDKKYNELEYFNPIQDGDNNWVISVEEVQFCSIDEFMWVKVLPLIDFIPPTDPFG